MPYPDVCLDDREKCPNEMAVLRYYQDACHSKSVQLRDEDGTPIALTDRQVWLVLKETVETSKIYLAKQATIENAAEGIVKMTLTQKDTIRPGMFIAEFSVYQAAQGGDSSSSEASSSPASECEIFYRVRCYVEIQQSVENISGQFSTLSIAELRLAIRDKCRYDNFLLDNVEFSDTELSAAIHRPVLYWNETPPPIRTYTTTNFPFKYHWTLGAIGELLQIAAIHYDRNTMGYQAGGIAIDDRQKAAAYYRASEQFRKEYQQWVAVKKRSINVGLAFGHTDIQSFGNNRYPYS